MRFEWMGDEVVEIEASPDVDLVPRIQQALSNGSHVLIYPPKSLELTHG